MSLGARILFGVGLFGFACACGVMIYWTWCACRWFVTRVCATWCNCNAERML